jgi:hypothetical protein
MSLVTDDNELVTLDVPFFYLPFFPFLNGMALKCNIMARPKYNHSDLVTFTIMLACCIFFFFQLGYLVFILIVHRNVAKVLILLICSSVSVFVLVLRLMFACY